ncbi:hypothetical protein MIMGU_mgv1a025909mg [Erythranthe guttata]|uniref:3'-5' exonuclease domain-containing protein n=1 Tax=Erythranthe guttata TaxID=4155 RepID=A0A022QM43_ERYGU|nr:PREDICTED: exonuclease 3'-5' domain-containing protein 2-like [Erythranthe guttata]EYU28991.1 hypothetical protein MIMGU_mgv1a025909mg [Erythranthe guttata]|eukprot:XP_012847404.1 PREDICTED: exonuclease 3'-5' domain-containing protein 2-like [Erythranthe guttata]
MTMSTSQARRNLFSVPFFNECIHVTVTKEARQVHERILSICSIHIDFSKNLLIGLDTEWLPNLNPGENHPIAILQLSIGNRCLIFQLLHADFIPVSLHAFLADPRHTFCGVGIKDDVDKLYDHHKLRVRKIADLNDLARLATINSQSGNAGYKYMGLKKMAYAVLGKKMEKPLNVTLSKWDAVELDRDQIEYAAIDAVVSYQLGYTLCSPIYRPQPGFIVVGRPGLLLV